MPGRLCALSAGLLVLLFVARQLVDLPEVVQLFRRVVSAAFLLSAAWLLFQVVVRNRRWLLWRVRVKLILSYVFLGFVPVVLVAAFSLAGGSVVYQHFAAYLFHEGLQDLHDDAQRVAVSAAADLARSPGTADDALGRAYAALSDRYPALSLVVVGPPRPDGGTTAAPEEPIAVMGQWRHAPAPVATPGWLAGRQFTGLLIYITADGEPHLNVRSVAPIRGGSAVVIVDLPVDTEVIAALDDRTGTRVRRIFPESLSGVSTVPADGAAPEGSGLMLFRRTVAFMDYVADWENGRTQRVQASLEAPVGRLYNQLISVQPNDMLEAFGSGFLLLLGTIGVLFLVVQGAALVMGAMLARSITHAVHELFVGTERIQQGDFTHRIPIQSRDQLGALAESFNRMSASIEHLLHVQREKQRLDDELRIAREIQKSLLPDEPPRIDGLRIADLCEPAREVGGDYFDFFVLGPKRLGVMIADVSGKGTSAALYMAELKGLMLALSHDEPSPRQLLIDVNRRLAGQLDSRSFITMTYMVIDLEVGEFTFARAGHTPLVVVSQGESQVLLPDGMVLGLLLPDAEQRFEELLHEHTQPLHAGDVIVLYTDGVTEAMDGDGELFGDTTLAQVVASHHKLDPAGIRERVVREVKAFVGDAEPHDDMTMIVLKVSSEWVA